MTGIGKTGGKKEIGSERWRHREHWQTPRQIEIVTSGVTGRIVIEGVVPDRRIRRVREITVRHSGTNNTVVTMLYDVTVKLSFDVSAQSTRVWSSQDGRKVPAGTSVAFESSDVTGGTTFITAAGLEGRGI